MRNADVREVKLAATEQELSQVLCSRAQIFSLGILSVSAERDEEGHSRALSNSVRVLSDSSSFSFLSLHMGVESKF